MDVFGVEWWRVLLVLLVFSSHAFNQYWQIKRRREARRQLLASPFAYLLLMQEEFREKPKWKKILDRLAFPKRRINAESTN